MNKHIVKHIGGGGPSCSVPVHDQTHTQTFRETFGTHPLNASGTHPDGITKVGRWWDTNRHPEGLNVRPRWGAKKSKHSNYFHHGFFMVPLVASNFGHLHPDFLRFLWNFALVDHTAYFSTHVATREACVHASKTFPCGVEGLLTFLCGVEGLLHNRRGLCVFETLRCTLLLTSATLL